MNVNKEIVMTVKLTGRIDSANAAETEKKINEQIGDFDGELVLDASELEYISSAGLRVILRLKKANKSTKVINCNSEVYEIFDMTGFTEMMDIAKAYRKLSVEGCEVIGEGANGKVYRTDPDTIVKVYKNPDSLDEIHNERELARKAFVMGIPTAIPYDVVQVGDLYGSVFELLNAKSFAKLMAEGEDIDELAKQSVDILKTIHSTELKEGELPSKKQEAIGWAEYVKPHLPEEIGDKLLRLFNEIPESNFMLHGDYHIKNIMRQGNENLLIDMDTLSVGHPVFELSQMYLAYLGFSETDHDDVMRFLGIERSTAEVFWDATLKYYFDGKDDGFINDAVIKARIIGYARLLRRTIKRSPDKTDIIENCTNQLCELVPKTDKLYF
ncbi:MAG: STAS domain-containing protein [Ruminococcaceae bacterium]|nr:STAS domain-containing protein [Oscillospiraceae bacterium]